MTSKAAKALGGSDPRQIVVASRKPNPWQKRTRERREDLRELWIFEDLTHPYHFSQSAMGWEANCQEPAPRDLEPAALYPPVLVIKIL